MQAIRHLIRILDGISDWVGRIGAWSVLAMMLVTVFEVVSRRVFNAPGIWAFETITMLFGFHFMIVAAYALLHRSIVSVDLLYTHLGPRAQALLSIASYLVLFFPFVITVAVHGIAFTEYSWSMGETSNTAFAPPLYPFKAVIPVCFALLALQGLSETLKHLLVLIEGGDQPEAQHE